MEELELSEKQITKAITDELQWRMNLKQLLWIKNNRFAGKFLRKDGSQGFIKNTGRGSPDLIIVLPNTVLWVEVKTKKGFLSEFQKMWQEKLANLGQLYYIVRSHNDFTKILKKFNL